ncbi:MAG: hypothetical protein KQ78_00025 [Candidatus Izimaplasma bacterium HR2]|nr:MAG: hypothetical protein KQ78_00025 [Candidatus Izimaplasma bacterium HR2]
MRYMIIMEDGGIYSINEISEDIFKAFDDRFLDIIDCETQTVYIGDNNWQSPSPI